MPEEAAQTPLYDLLLSAAPHVPEVFHWGPEPGDPALFAGQFPLRSYLEQASIQLLSTAQPGQSGIIGGTRSTARAGQDIRRYRSRRGMEIQKRDAAPYVSSPDQHDSGTKRPTRIRGWRPKRPTGKERPMITKLMRRGWQSLGGRQFSTITRLWLSHLRGMFPAWPRERSGKPSHFLAAVAAVSMLAACVPPVDTEVTRETFDACVQLMGGAARAGSETVNQCRVAAIEIGRRAHRKPPSNEDLKPETAEALIPKVQAPANSIAALAGPLDATCTPVPLRSDAAGWCTISSNGYNTCRGCREDFEKACQDDWLRKRGNETLDQCVLRQITERNVCRKRDLVPDGTTGLAIDISKYDGHPYYDRDCYLPRHEKAIPDVEYFKGYCADNLGPSADDSVVQKCKNDMVARWEAGDDDPRPRTIAELAAAGGE